jgi:hypothetical protein
MRSVASYRSLYNRSSAKTSNNVVEMLIYALRRKYGDPIKEADQSKFRADLKRLPDGHTAKPTFLLNRHEDGGPPFGLIFPEGDVLYESLRRFDTGDAAIDYATWFLMRLAELRHGAAPGP